MNANLPRRLFKKRKRASSESTASGHLAAMASKAFSETSVTSTLYGCTARSRGNKLRRLLSRPLDGGIFDLNRKQVERGKVRHYRPVPRSLPDTRMAEIADRPGRVFSANELNDIIDQLP